MFGEKAPCFGVGGGEGGGEGGNTGGGADQALTAGPEEDLWSIAPAEECTRSPA